MKIDKLERNDKKEVNEVNVVTDISRDCHNCGDEVQLQVELIEQSPREVGIALSYECPMCGSESIAHAELDFVDSSFIAST